MHMHWGGPPSKDDGTLEENISDSKSIHTSRNPRKKAGWGLEELISPGALACGYFLSLINYLADKEAEIGAEFIYKVGGVTKRVSPRLYQMVEAAYEKAQEYLLNNGQK